MRKAALPDEPSCRVRGQLLARTGSPCAPGVPRLTSETPNLAFLGTQLAWELGRLFLLGFVASVIAGRGVQMYAVAGRAEAAARSPLE